MSDYGIRSDPQSSIRYLLDLQVENVLKKIETARGIAYSNLLYRFSDSTPPRSPVFVIGCSRTGTTILYRLLASARELKSLNRETNTIWERVNGVNKKDQYWQGDVLTEDDATAAARAFAYQNFNLYFGKRRLIEKSPRNCFRIRFLNALFPDAKYVFIYRRGEDTVNSMLNGLEIKYRLRFPPRPNTSFVRLGKSPRAGWYYGMPEKWTDLIDNPANQAFAQLWIEANRAMLRDRGLIPTDRLFEIRYEDLVENPPQWARIMCDFIGIPFGPAMKAFARKFKPVNFTTPPRKDKWKDEHKGEILEVLPMLQETTAELGYEIRP